ncbi:bifunctional solanapyrone synthase [Cucurbitaria berberidis CBS 394.84]|uniref:Bifunctional solanapyrone synthase n=1 Tax=Cucurbitaria berberidis CBS 394.84 TaxID=1168544 RepID=A0A9P4L6B3_9PLEO|nr:bifunctional solanapyrone synthase [Cucurbitaria berberidis CBS 394.84]KAF1843187.1 bifunctional solanapyrone synthase [Cucurbitaria berberidis CBS 394.84]
MHLGPRQVQQSPTAACALLRERTGNATFFSTDGVVYDNKRKAHWSQTAWKSPACIVSPKCTDEVIDAMKILRSTNTTFAIRSGGHSPLSGWADVNNGVLIAMRDLSDKVYDEATQTVRVGFGSTWDEVYKLLEGYGRSAVGGRAATVGMGFILGGGLSHLSNAYGFGSDNVVSFEVVLANATLLTVSGTSNPDLFYALKSGANNYGIITHITMKTFPLGKVWGGTIVYTGDFRDELMQAFATYQQNGQRDTKSAVLSYLAINNATAYVSLIYLDPVERPAAFEPFYNITGATIVADTTAIHDSFSSVIAADIDRVVPRWTFGATTFYLDNDTYLDAAKIAQEATKQLSNINGATLVLMPQPISRSMMQASHASGETPFAVTDREQMWFCINFGWNFASDDEAVGKILMHTLHTIDVLTKQRGLYDPFIFSNDAYRTQDPLRSYGMNTLRRMRGVANKYDPERIFQTRVPGGFKVDRT